MVQRLAQLGELDRGKPWGRRENLVVDTEYVERERRRESSAADILSRGWSTQY